MAIRSMTGFARVRRQAGELAVTVSVKSVNHRGLDLHFHIGADLDPFEGAMRARIKQQISRGHVDVRVHVESGGETGGLRLDEEKLSAYLRAFRVACQKHGLTGEPDLNQALRVPGVLEDASLADTPAAFEQLLLGALDEALETLNRFRAREGAEIAALLRDRCQAIRNAAREIEGMRGHAFPALQARLSERLSELLGPAGIDPQRLAQEAAMLSDRSDIAEETERLRIHAGQLEELLEAGGETGKKLDFLLQEMNRETNTILSKTSGLGDAGLRITNLGLAVKSDIERVREQALNLE